jgi:hypothetical protein
VLPGDWQLVELNPAWVTAQRKVNGTARRKTDPVDLVAIADLLLAGRGGPVVVGDEPLIELTAWVDRSFGQRQRLTSGGDQPVSDLGLHDHVAAGEPGEGPVDLAQQLVFQPRPDVHPPAAMRHPAGYQASQPLDDAEGRGRGATAPRRGPVGRGAAPPSLPGMMVPSRRRRSGPRGCSPPRPAVRLCLAGAVVRVIIGSLCERIASAD